MATSEQFRAAMIEAYRTHGFKSYRQAGIRAGLEYTRIARMLKGTIPGPDKVIKWATAINEPVNKWLLLAGYAPIEGGGPPDIPRESNEPTGESPIIWEAPNVPQAIQEAIAAAESTDDKIAVAFSYVRSIPGLKFGAHKSDVIDTRLRIVRMYELVTGKRLLPPEVK